VEVGMSGVLDYGGVYTGGAGMAVCGNRMYLSSGSYALGIVNLAFPGGPEVLGTCPIGHACWAVAANSTYAFLVCEDDSIRVVGVAASAQPVLLGSWPQRLPATAIVASGDYVWVYGTNGRLHLFDAADPLHPTEAGYYDAPSDEYTWMLRTEGSIAALGSENRVSLFDASAVLSARPASAPQAEVFELYGGYPNPFNPATMIRFMLPQTERATLAVYDVTGRRVSTLCDGPLEAGEHRVAFDGSALASGVYFARLEAGGRNATHKLMLLK
jgi:hypothetical protein